MSPMKKILKRLEESKVEDNTEEEKNYTHAVLIGKDNIDGEGENAHLFLCKSKDSNPFGIHKPSLCNQVIRANSTPLRYENGKPVMHEIDSEELRIQMAEYQSKIDVCGMCVATLYAD